MKFAIYSLVLLSSCAVFGLPALAVDPTGPNRNMATQMKPLVQIDAQAARVLQQATQIYHGAQGFRFRYEERIPTQGFKVYARGVYAFQKPNFLRATDEENGVIAVNNASNFFFSVNPGKYQKGESQPAYGVLQQPASGWGIVDWIYHLTAAESLTDVTAQQLDRKGVYRLRYLPSRILDGFLMEGVQLRDAGRYKDVSVWRETTAWFGVEDHLLHRTQYRGHTDVAGSSTFSCRLFDIVLDPEFEPGTFEFVPPPGAKEGSLF